MEKYNNDNDNINQFKTSARKLVERINTNEVDEKYAGLGALSERIEKKMKQNTRLNQQIREYRVGPLDYP